MYVRSPSTSSVEGLRCVVAARGRKTASPAAWPWQRDIHRLRCSAQPGSDEGGKEGADLGQGRARHRSRPATRRPIRTACPTRARGGAGDRRRRRPAGTSPRRGGVRPCRHPAPAIGKLLAETGVDTVVHMDINGTRSGRAAAGRRSRRPTSSGPCSCSGPARRPRP
ncbi:hypothetical protein NKH77_29980 [Streptomyces sp. M19]